MKATTPFPTSVLRPLVSAALVAALSSAGLFAWSAQTTSPLPAQVPAASAELVLDQGKRLFDALQYDQAVPTFDRLIQALTAGGQIQKPDVLVQAYALRARARFALGDQPGAEQDFSALLLVDPSYALPAGVSPRVVAVFDAVKKVTVGQATMSMTPPGDVQIDGRPYALTADAKTVDLPAGEHTVTAARAGYRALSQKFTVSAADIATVALTMDRESSTLAVVSIPDDVEVLLDGTSRGRTQRGDADGSTPLTIGDLQPGSHRLQLRRDCFKEVEQTITIDKPGDLRAGPVRLTPATASVTISTSATGAAILFVDGTSRGTVTAAPLTLCEGPHTIEVRSPTGRFVDKREWKTGDTKAMTADLRSAFAIVASKAGSGLSAEQVRANIERALEPAKRVLVYVPADVDVATAMRDQNVPGDWLQPAPPGTEATAQRVQAQVRRDVGRQIAQKLDVQGVAAVGPGPDPYTLSVSLLASGSGEPDVININLSDNSSRSRAIDALSQPLPPILVSSLQSSTIDLDGVKGAVVIRAGGAGAKAGLAVGDTVVGAGGAPVASAADLRTKLAAARPGQDLALSVKNPAGETRQITGAVALVPDTIPLRDPTMLYNRALTDLEDAVKTARSPVEQGAAHVNLAIVLMRLGNWDNAQTELTAAQLPDGPGVSAGTIAYLNGLCLDALGRSAEAQAAFTKAAASPLARLSSDGPLVAPLARAKVGK
jgi:tetratricopeptide (TPR) repeat protein